MLLLTQKRVLESLKRAIEEDRSLGDLLLLQLLLLSSEQKKLLLKKLSLLELLNLLQSSRRYLLSRLLILLKLIIRQFCHFLKIKLRTSAKFSKKHQFSELNFYLAPPALPYDDAGLVR